MGVMPRFFADRYSSTAPLITPWSVSATAVCPIASTRSSRRGIRQEPSSTE